MEGVRVTFRESIYLFWLIHFDFRAAGEEHFDFMFLFRVIHAK